jgi:hypothetical protein
MWRCIYTMCIAVVLAASLGCVPTGPLPVVPAGELLAGALSTPGARQVQASGTIQIASPDGVFNGGLLLFYRYPDSLKAMVQVGFGTTVAEIGFGGSHGIAYLPQQKEAYVLGVGSALVIGTTTAYPALLIDLMAPPEAVRDNDGTLSVSSSEGRYYLQSESPAGSRTWRIQGRSRDLRAEDFVAAESDMEWHRSFTVRRNQRVPVNFTVRFGEMTMTVNLKRIDVSPNWSKSPFEVRLPEGLVPIEPSYY